MVIKQVVNTTLRMSREKMSINQSTKRSLEMVWEWHLSLIISQERSKLRLIKPIMISQKLENLSNIFYNLKNKIS